MGFRQNLHEMRHFLVPIIIVIILYALCVLPEWNDNVAPMILSGIVLGAAPLLLGIGTGERWRVDVPALLLGAAVGLLAAVFGRMVRLGALPIVFTSPAAYLLIGLLLGNGVTSLPMGRQCKRTRPVQLWTTAATLAVLALSAIAKCTPLNLLIQLLPFGLGILLVPVQPNKLAGVRIALAAAFSALLLLILWALLGQSGVLPRDGVGSRLNMQLFRMRGMSNFTACLLALCGAELHGNLTKGNR